MLNNNYKPRMVTVLIHRAEIVFAYIYISLQKIVTMICFCGLTTMYSDPKLPIAPSASAISACDKMFAGVTAVKIVCSELTAPQYPSSTFAGVTAVQIVCSEVAAPRYLPTDSIKSAVAIKFVGAIDMIEDRTHK